MIQHDTLRLWKSGKACAGFTLVEVMVAAGIFTLIMSLIMVAYVASQREFITGFTRLSLTREVRMAMDWMRRDIKSAARLLPSFSWGGFNYSFVNGGETLIFEIPSIDPAGDAIAGNFDVVIYTLNTGQLRRIVDPAAASSQPGGTSVIANDVQQLEFTLLSPSRVGVVIQASRNVLGGRLVEAIVQSALTLRNF